MRIKIYKKRGKNKEIKKNISSTSARAREVENFEVLDGKEEKENQQKKDNGIVRKDSKMIKVVQDLVQESILL